MLAMQRKLKSSNEAYDDNIEIMTYIAIYLPKYSQDIFGIFLHMAISGIRAFAITLVATLLFGLYDDIHV